MLEDFIQNQLAQIDDLAELKVSIVALRLLDDKQSDTASLTIGELAAAPGLRNGLGFAPQLALAAALQRAVARRTLLCDTAPSLNEARYYANNEASRRVIETIEIAESHLDHNRMVSLDNSIIAALDHIARLIERLETIDIYIPDPQEREWVEEWLAQGYSQDEIETAVRKSLRTPRLKGTSPRTLKMCASQVTSQPPGSRSRYYNIVLQGTEPLTDWVIAFRELTNRLPNGHEFNLVRGAVSIYGANSTIETMKRVLSPQHEGADALLPLLAEREEAELSMVHEQSKPDIMLRELVQLYESTFGLPPSSDIAQDMRGLMAEVTDVVVWRAAMEYAAAQNRRSWQYVRKVLLNPSPTLFEPVPVNATARYAFDEYKRRINRTLDASVAIEMNQVAEKITDQSKWVEAFNKAASANALNWNYLRTVLAGPVRGKTSEVRDGRRSQGTKRGVTRRPQVEDATEAELEAARERARQRIAERARRREATDQSGGSPRG